MIDVKEWFEYNEEENGGLYTYHKEEITRVEGYRFQLRFRDGELVIPEEVKKAFEAAQEAIQEHGGEIDVQLESSTGHEGEPQSELVVYRLKEGWRNDPLNDLPNDKRIEIASEYWADK